MDWERRCLRTCAAALACAIVLRLISAGDLSFVASALENPQAVSFLVYLQTGRVVRLPQAETAVALSTQETTQTENILSVQFPQPVSAETVFSGSDLDLVSVKYTCDYRPDLEALLTQPLSFDLSGEEPTVLILHTHTTESYTKTDGQSYEETSSYRTLNQSYNMLAVGDLVAAKLESAGISVIHDRSFHDYPSYNGSYNDAASSTSGYIAQYPSIRLILDLHRDASETSTGQLSTQCSVGGQTSAQLMMVVGTDAGGLNHPNWQENLALALKLQVVLEKQNPGICRDLKLASARYNQHFTTGAMLIEVGAAGNTLDEALIAADALADGIIALFQ